MFVVNKNDGNFFLTFAHAVWVRFLFSRSDVSYHVSQFRPWSILLKSCVDSTSTASCSSRMVLSKSGPHVLRRALRRFSGREPFHLQRLNSGKSKSTPSR